MDRPMGSLGACDRALAIADPSLLAHVGGCVSERAVTSVAVRGGRTSPAFTMPRIWYRRRFVNDCRLCLSIFAAEVWLTSKFDRLKRGR